MKRITWIILTYCCIGLALSLVSCANVEVKQSSTAPVITEEGPIEAYPKATNTYPPTTLPYPDPLHPTMTPVTVEPVQLPLDLPQPAEGLATIGGLVVDKATSIAPPESLIYLAPVKYTDQGLAVVSLNRQRDPFTILPPNGVFVFRDVPPGEYGVVFFTPDISYLLEYDNGESVLVNLEPNQILDIGEFVVELF